MSVTLAEMEELVAEFLATEDELETLKRQKVKPLEEKIAVLEGRILDVLWSNDITSYRAKAVTVIRATRYTVATPKTQEDKAAYFAWLRAKSEETYWAQMSVNSQTLNSFYKAEMEVAKESGDIDFKIPGLGEPEAKPYLTRRKR